MRLLEVQGAFNAHVRLGEASRFDRWRDQASRPSLAAPAVHDC